MDRILWTKKAGFKSKFKCLKNEQHCGNCALRGTNGCLTAIILEVTSDTVTVQSRCSGIKRTYKKKFEFKGVVQDLIKRDLTNHRNYKVFGTIKGRGNGHGTK